uniref:Uncharacterized protein n=1 Tax=Mesocestoides corti TaxID=53468 RepID=A0A5K3G5L9_MESCO
MKKTCKRERALLTNHKLEPHIRRRPFESTTLPTLLILYWSSFVPVSCWLFWSPSLAIVSRIDAGLAEAR